VVEEGVWKGAALYMEEKKEEKTMVEKINQMITCLMRYLCLHITCGTKQSPNAKQIDQQHGGRM